MKKKKTKEEDRKFWESFMNSVDSEAFRECPECGHILDEPLGEFKIAIELVWIKSQGCEPPIILHCRNCDSFYAVTFDEDEHHPELCKLTLEIDVKKLKKLKKD